MATYQVSLDIFEGPLDLLLRLIEREELDITRISLALVADQYLAHLDQVRHASAASLADFLLIAARLLVIKSRVLLPRPEEPEEEEEEDWESDLVDQLREYKRFKEAAAWLRQIEEAGRRAYPRVAPPPRLEPRLQPGEASIEELLAALKRVLDARAPTPPVDGIVSPMTVHLADCIAAILSRVRRARRVRFSFLMRTARSRLEIVVTFLALLELIKQQQVRATQERPFGEIYIERREPDPPDESAPGANVPAEPDDA
ncbi:MAG: segregation/condensation protein A [Chloroflexi bacterium]|nr:segregation/condensation protein A [Chloroflexota bacterium]